MEFITALETAEKWGVSLRYVQALCQKERIPGAHRRGRDWLIPANAVRPPDGRSQRGKNVPPSRTEIFPRNTPFLSMTDLYKKPGSAAESIQSLSGTPEAQLLLSSGIDYYQGQIDKVCENVSVLMDRHTSFYAVLAAGMIMARCAIWKGDLLLWRRAKIHIAEAPAQNDQDRDMMTLSIMSVDSLLYDVSTFPEWFKIGCFECLHRDSLPAAKVFYAKYLYAAAYAVATKEVTVEGIQGLALMGLLPATVEPMISQAMADDSIISEAYLRLTCACIYLTVHREDQAIRHIDRAIALLLPDKLYGILAEYVRLLGSLLEQRLPLQDPEAWPKVQALHTRYYTGWAHLSGSVRGRTIATTLSAKERQVAKLAAFGLSNKEIADKLHMSLSGVKQAVRIVSEKTGMRRDEFAAVL